MCCYLKMKYMTCTEILDILSSSVFHDISCKVPTKQCGKIFLRKMHTPSFNRVSSFTAFFHVIADRKEIVGDVYNFLLQVASIAASSLWQLHFRPFQPPLPLDTSMHFHRLRLGPCMSSPIGMCNEALTPRGNALYKAHPQCSAVHYCFSEPSSGTAVSLENSPQLTLRFFVCFSVPQVFSIQGFTASIFTFEAKMADPFREAELCE